MDDMTSKGRRSMVRAYGEANGWAKLSVDDVLAIRRLAGEGRSQRSIAREFTINKATVARVLRGETWRHVA